MEKDEIYLEIWEKRYKRIVQKLTRIEELMIVIKKGNKSLDEE